MAVTTHAPASVSTWKWWGGDPE